MVEKEKLSRLISEYLKLKGIEFVAIADLNGSLIYVEKNPNFTKSDKDLRALIKSVMDTITDKYNAGSLSINDQRIVFIKAGSQAILITCIQPMVSLDAIFPYAYIIAEKISRSFDNRPVSSILPNFGPIIPITGSSKSKVLKGFVLFTKSSELTEPLSYKMVIGGEYGVGKTSLVHTFISGKFDHDAVYKATIGTSILKKECKLQNLELSVNLLIWDLGGQEQFAQVRPKYMKDAKAGFLVFDVTRIETFDKISRWYEDFKSSGYKDLKLILIGNKIDLYAERKITTEQGMKLAEQLGIPYLETSALNSEIVDEAFQTIAFKLIQDKIQMTPKD